MRELLFNVTQESDGGYVAVAVGQSIVIQGDSWDELCSMVLEATQLSFYDRTPPDRIRLFLHLEQVLAEAWGSRAMSSADTSQIISSAVRRM